MKWYLFISLFVLTAFWGCKPVEIAGKAKNNSDTLNNHNNEVIVSGTNTLNMAHKNETKIIFNGQDNRVVFEYFDSFFNSKNNRDVVIIEGKGNEIRFLHNRVVDNSTNSMDTIIIRGNSSYAELLQQYVLDNSTSSNWDEFIELNKNVTVIENNAFAIITDSSEIENQMTNELMEFRDVFKYYLNETNKGNPTAAFYLGELYYVGLGVDYNPSKAVEYYLIAATNGNASAQSTLGYIYENSFEGVGLDLIKAKYWYEKASGNGNQFAVERLKAINNE